MLTSEDLQKITEKFPDDLVEKKDTYRKGRKSGSVDFVPWHEYAARLNRIRPGAWSSRVAFCEVIEGEDDDGDLVQTLLIVVDVTIDGATHSGTGSAPAAKESWGGGHAEAYSQAFRRACAHHGLGLYLYGGTAADDAPRPTQAGGPTDAQLARMKDLIETGVFPDKKIEEWRDRLRKSYKTTTAGLIVREMKDEYRGRTGMTFEPS